MAAVYRANEGATREGKYRLLVELGQGGTANVYVAVARGPAGFNKLVVLKALKRNLSDDPEFRNMFLNEARLAARLNHPNIVQANEVVDDLGVPVIVMEYLEGQPLSNILIRGRGGAFTLGMHLRVIVDALSGLHTAHELADFDGTPLGVVHRDMTPHNVFVTFEGSVKVLDFGIAKLAASLVETQAGVMKGKLRYMPPEQIAGQPVDRRADIYAVGVMLWEAAAGERLWRGQADAAIMHKVMNGQIPSPRTLNPNVSAQLEAICMKALAPKREDRYTTALELEQALDEFIAELGTPVTNRAIGKVVATLFADVRSKTKAMIEEQLSRVASLTGAEYDTSQGLFNAPTMTISSLTASSSISEAGYVGGNTGPWRRWPAPALALIAALALGGGYFVWKGTPKNDADNRQSLETAAAAATAVSRPDPVDKTRTPDRILVRVAASPPEAKLYFDEEQLSSNPTVRTMPADGSQHIVRAEASGYSTGRAVVLLEKDTEVMLALEKSSKPSAQSGPPRGSRPSTPHTVAPPQPTAAPLTTSPAPTKPDCNPPYFVDSHGIKRYKAECM
jgi:serine/threonine protein kinase